MIGLINFTHSDPLYSAYPDKSLVKRDTPKRILSSVLNGELDCGMISLFEYFENNEKLDLVKSATIHSRRGTMSTLLVTRNVRISGPMRISVTEHTRTTAVYLELILKKLGIDYTLIWSKERDAEPLLQEAEYALVIGDEALKVYGTNLRIVWDIGFQFSSLFSMMPVFSVTVSGKSRECSREISALDQAIIDAPSYEEECARDDSGKLNLREDLLRQYFRTIRYDFDNEVLKTINFLSAYYTSAFRK